VDSLDLGRLTGPALVLDFSSKWPKGLISEDDLAEATRDYGLTREDAVLIWTGADRYLGEEDFLGSYPGISEAASKLLVEVGVRLVGTDAPSIDHPEDGAFPAHHTLFPGGVLVIENLVSLPELLKTARGRRFLLHTFPLKIRGGTGSPIRAVAVVDDY
jgi:kynurenine formamidase